MTRKCVMCKETNYKNSYSFFSAPKDPETRQKWQEAIAIENYEVTDDTYVCSKHFYRDDIITHWVSGVPPYVITIKYKKCRLRPGAVPDKNYHEENEDIGQEHSDCYDEGKDFGVPRTEEKLEINCYEKHRPIPLHYKYSREFHDHNYMPNAKSNTMMEELEDDTDTFVDAGLNEDTSSNNEEVDQYEICTEDSRVNDAEVESESNSKVSGPSKETEMQFWDNIVIKDEPMDNGYKENESLSTEKQMSSNCNQSASTAYNNYEENEMLFEDLLEICTEVVLPRSWSCLVMSTGHTTTVVYVYMAMTKSGMPFMEKQVFIKSDMIIHCVAVNREINPLIHNLIKEGKNLRVQNLLDIEELIDEFDQRMICQGIYNDEGFRKVTGIKIAYKDGVKWRHILCPLIMNNGSLRCTRCITLSNRLQRRSKTRHPLSYNLPMFTRNDQRLHTLRHKYKRTKNQARKHGFIKVSKK
ncbi:uncharacterized protein LOC143215743 [Lasioglossum baleicum]|uniref:uncharacterized protein LOC143215743 n=1 Tax=Lasioglossum baleicum TaxID=434251 RepID=UPI003FCCB192